jgi:hypothetical protein
LNAGTGQRPCVHAREAGLLSREELSRRVGARRWGPGRFQNALVSALDEGRIRRDGRTRYAPPDSGNSG